MTLRDLRRFLDGSRIDDVLLSGFIDRNESGIGFHPLLGSYFLECEGKLLRFSSMGYSGRGLLASVQLISPDAELDDDMEFAVASVRQIFLRDPDAENRILRLHIWDAIDGTSGVECSAAQIDLANGQILFLDPSYHFGVRIGGPEQRGIWLENARQKDHVATLIDLSGASLI